VHAGAVDMFNQNNFHRKIQTTDERTRKNLYKKKQWRPLSKKKKRGKNQRPRNRKACHSVSTALMKSVAGIGTQRAMKSSRKTLHEFTSTDESMH
jgi:hypothetical protein